MNNEYIREPNVSYRDKLRPFLNGSNLATYLLKIKRKREWNKIKKKEFPFKSIGIETIGNCNRNCNFCPRTKDRIGYLDEKYIFSIISSLENINYSGSLFFHFYNEPLLDHRLIKFIKTARKKLPDAFIKIVTNGDLLNNAILRDFYIAGVDEVKVSLYDENSERDFHILLNHPYYKDFVFGMRYYKHNPRMTNRAGTVESFGFSPANEWGCNKQEMYVDYKGNVTLCCHDFALGLKVGNVKQQDLLLIANNPNTMKLLKNIHTGNYPEVCKKCLAGNLKYEGID